MIYCYVSVNPTLIFILVKCLPVLREGLFYSYHLKKTTYVLFYKGFYFSTYDFRYYVPRRLENHWRAGLVICQISKLPRRMKVRICQTVSGLSEPDDFYWILKVVYRCRHALKWTLYFGYGSTLWYYIDLTERTLIAHLRNDRLFKSYYAHPRTKLRSIYWTTMCSIMTIKALDLCLLKMVKCIHCSVPMFLLNHVFRVTLETHGSLYFLDCDNHCLKITVSPSTKNAYSWSV